VHRVGSAFSCSLLTAGSSAFGISPADRGKDSPQAVVAADARLFDVVKVDVPLPYLG